ncbi:extensin family protein [Pantoea sp. MBD-2R]|uniref:extensin-like domain-containing protein n=1 Tax=unclassified Pantoea TaxID=2630326 RepID=UPI0011BD754D|nr:extensin family protein [Pantoea sp. CCBC3-3-1]
MKGLIAVGVVILLVLLVTPFLEKNLPSEWNPFTPLRVTDAPTVVTRYKLKRLQGDTAGCIAILQNAREAGYIRFSQPPPVSGACPIAVPIRVQSFGDVRLSASFLASCSLALSTTMFVTQVAKPLAAAELGSSLAQIDHLGSYACRNIYHRAQGRLSEHATADALDIAGFRLQNGRRISVLQDWPRQQPQSHWLQAVFQQSCDYYGNALGPGYNSAHANHFHLGMRGFNLCSAR